MRTVVGVLRGGPSREYDVSLKTGSTVLEHLNRDIYEPRDIFIDREGVWHVHGVAVSPEKALAGVDVVFNAMHGEYGEDGQVQRILDRVGVPYTGSGALASAVAFNKHHTREVAKKLGVKVAHGQVLDYTDDIEGLAHRLFRSFPHPAIIKPVAAGSSHGVFKADTYHGLLHALREAGKHSPKILIEEFIPGREATVGVIDNYRGEDVYALMPTEILMPPGVPFYDAYTKQGSLAQFMTPSRFDEQTKTSLQELAKAVHKGLGLSHYSRSDFIVSKRGIYFLETETSVDLAHDTEFVHGLAAIGTKVSDFLHHVVGLASRRQAI